MKIKGLLLPIYSLPSRYGIGEFSKEAFFLIDSLKENGFNAWQILPLNPIGYGHSPYQPFSSYAIEELYISLDDLHSRGLIGKPIPFNEGSENVAYEETRKLKNTYYLEAFVNYRAKYGNKEILKFGEENQRIKEYCKFISLKEINENKCWNEWKIFEHKSLEELTNYHLFLQMILFQEWNDIRGYAKEKGISIIGDLPFYVGYDSEDVYNHKKYFLMENNIPTYVAGVGPDYFSEDGQLWGNPIYFYGPMYKEGYSFIVDRVVNASKLYDIIRLDHFRAYDSYYVIPYGSETAKNGQWWDCPGHEIIDKIYEKKPDIQLIAEDLGLLRPQVIALRDFYKLPGMNVIQFNIFDDIKGKKDNSNLISYLGTHDNMTTKSFIHSLKGPEKSQIKKYFKHEKIKHLSLLDSFIEYLFKQENPMISYVDLLKLDDNWRINEPSTLNNKNWSKKLVNFDKLFKQMKKVSKWLK